MTHPFDVVIVALEELGPYRLARNLRPEAHPNLIAMLKRAPVGTAKRDSETPWSAVQRSADVTMDRAENMALAEPAAFVAWVKEIRDNACREMVEELEKHAENQTDKRLVCCVDEWFAFLSKVNGGVLTIFFGCLYYFEPIRSGAPPGAPELVLSPAPPGAPGGVE